MPSVLIFKNRYQKFENDYWGSSIKELVKKINKKETFKQSKADKTVDPNVSALERNLTELLGLRVAIAVRGDGGALTVQYDTLEQLDELCRRLCHQVNH